MARAATRKAVLDKIRPVLASELSDFETPYMMKRVTREKMLHSIARNEMEKKLVDRVLNRQPDLIKARVQAPMPPEVLEPLFAFLGHQNWNFNPQERLAQQIDSAGTALQRFEIARATKRLQKEGEMSG